jgi:hypothetical protein
MDLQILPSILYIPLKDGRYFEEITKSDEKKGYGCEMGAVQGYFNIF